MKRFAMTVLLILCPLAMGQAPAPNPTPAPTPAPTPKPQPQPAPVIDFTPEAKLTGVFWPNQGGASGSVIGMIILDASASSSNRPIRWKRATAPSYTSMVLSPQNGPKDSFMQAIIIEPGTYTFTAIARGTTGGEPDADAAVFTYVVAPNPVPPPTPIPVPPSPSPVPPSPPAPSPVTAKPPLSAVLIFDTNAMTSALATVRTGNLIRPALASLKTDYHSLSTDSPDFTAKHFDGWVAKAGGAPALIVLDANHAVVSAAPAPATEDGVISLIKTLRGASK